MNLQIHIFMKCFFTYSFLNNHVLKLESACFMSQVVGEIKKLGRRMDGLLKGRVVNSKEGWYTGITLIPLSNQNS